MGRKRLKGRMRTKSGRLSRAAAALPVDQGTVQVRRKRAALCNGGDPVLSASAIGVLLANSLIDVKQARSAEIYRNVRAVSFGLPVPSSSMHSPSGPTVRTDEQLWKGAP